MPEPTVQPNIAVEKVATQSQPLLQSILNEVGDAGKQAEKTRAEGILKYSSLIPRIEAYKDGVKRNLIVYISRFGSPQSSISQDDIAPIGSMLASMGEVENLDLMINSPGGSGVVAEKIVEMCRRYCTKEFRVIVPNMAKSAATMISLGADKIIMGYCSELGPIDAQKFINIGGMVQQVSAQSFIDARDKLIDKLHEAKKNNEEYMGYLQLLSSSTVEPAFIVECEREISFAKDFVKKWLTNYMLKSKYPSKTDKEREKIANTIASNLSSANEHFMHGRMIGMDECTKLELNIMQLDKTDALWNLFWELYVRAEVFLMASPGTDKPASKLFMDARSYLVAY
ncbi:MAG: Periplasmic serine protease (ClpP class) [Candidatus Woesebacteria bacterium GW2011_GWC1_38_13]|uniref:Periplasmic serine protease (ClpP class) n=2 Tax=Candidatus Woeseibacteriota TaxID=1752722 RepID=A0A0G0LTU3_9BACT|nr:MAG: Periplasmic serine protease (ClpP class) [Candidatus Woesebacteria bacterium GW2011_GWD1_38_10]KKQ55996.1 MAG: Periplasmic serine protease (ClpP class) [Candidatus Woesebacteria bacterium GW2011_GWC1_38_13]